MAWMVDGAPHLPGNFDDVDDFVHPLVLLATTSERLAGEAFPQDWYAMTEFARMFDARKYEPTPAGQRLATAMTEQFARRWFPAPVRWFGRDLTRFLAGERVSRQHGIGWLSPGREHLVRFVLRVALLAEAVSPDYRTPLPERLRRTRSRHVPRRAG